jgi:hypothetical protein
VKPFWAAEAPLGAERIGRARGGVVADRNPEAALFLFFSNRMGCGSSLLITALGSIVLLWLMGWLRF